MISVNYDAIENIINELVKTKQYKNRSQVYQMIAFELNVSSQQIWRLIERKQLNKFKQINDLAKTLEVDVMELITIGRSDYVPVTEIH